MTHTISEKVDDSVEGYKLAHFIAKSDAQKNLYPFKDFLG
jgi:hypothetical protein